MLLPELFIRFISFDGAMMTVRASILCKSSVCFEFVTSLFCNKKTKDYKMGQITMGKIIWRGVIFINYSHIMSNFTSIYAKGLK